MCVCACAHICIICIIYISILFIYVYYLQIYVICIFILSTFYSHIYIGKKYFYCCFPFPSKVKFSSLRLLPKNAVAKLFNQLGSQKRRSHRPRTTGLTQKWESGYELQKSNLKTYKPSFLHKEMKEENLSPKRYIQSTKRPSGTYISLHRDSDIDYDSDGRWNVNNDCNPWITEKKNTFRTSPAQNISQR